MIDQEKIVKRIGEIERKISDGEALLRNTNRRFLFAWIMTAIGLFFIIVFGDLFSIILGFLLCVGGGWTFSKLGKYRREIEDGLSEYRGQKAELDAKIRLKS
jgi:hypothetical protein